MIRPLIPFPRCHEGEQKQSLTLSTQLLGLHSPTSSLSLHSQSTLRLPRPALAFPHPFFFFFFFIYSLLACDLWRSWRGYVQSGSCLLSAQWRHVASTPLPSAQACPQKA